MTSWLLKHVPSWGAAVALVTAFCVSENAFLWAVVSALFAVNCFCAWLIVQQKEALELSTKTCKEMIDLNSQLMAERIERLGKDLAAGSGQHDKDTVQ